MIAIGNATVTILADSDTDKGSPIGLFIVLLLIVAVYFLYRSMARHVRRLPDSFDQAGDETKFAAGEADSHAGEPTDTR